jgi:endonuclease-3 related protein
VIDAYTMRLFSRLDVGPVASRDYATWQAFFTTHLPEDRDTWARYHALLVMHCKHLCRKRAPLRHQCTLAARCPAALA